MEVCIGDRLVDETGEWVVVGRPYMTAGGVKWHVRRPVLASMSLASSRLGPFPHAGRRSKHLQVPAPACESYARVAGSISSRRASRLFQGHVGLKTQHARNPTRAP